MTGPIKDTSNSINQNIHYTSLKEARDKLIKDYGNDAAKRDFFHVKGWFGPRKVVKFDEKTGWSFVTLSFFERILRLFRVKKYEGTRLDLLAAKNIKANPLEGNKTVLEVWETYFPKNPQQVTKTISADQHGDLTKTSSEQVTDASDKKTESSLPIVGQPSVPINPAPATVTSLPEPRFTPAPLPAQQPALSSLPMSQQQTAATPNVSGTENSRKSTIEHLLELCVQAGEEEREERRQQEEAHIASLSQKTEVTPSQNSSDVEREKKEKEEFDKQIQAFRDSLTGARKTKSQFSRELKELENKVLNAKGTRNRLRIEKELGSKLKNLDDQIRQATLNFKVLKEMHSIYLHGGVTIYVEDKAKKSEKSSVETSATQEDQKMSEKDRKALLELADDIHESAKKLQLSKDDQSVRSKQAGKIKVSQRNEPIAQTRFVLISKWAKELETKIEMTEIKERSIENLRDQFVKERSKLLNHCLQKLQQLALTYQKYSKEQLQNRLADIRLTLLTDAYIVFEKVSKELYDAWRSIERLRDPSNIKKLMECARAERIASVNYDILKKEKENLEVFLNRSS